MTSPRPVVVPGSTYRVQLHAGFTFDDVAAITDYLADLGITHLYCSPYLQAQAGSTHGYDVVDHATLNSDLGGGEGHARMVGALERHGLGQILDIVPNHMATDGRANRWWWDVMENGPSSPYAGHFDIDWGAPEDRGGRVLVPILGDHLGRVLETGEIAVVRDGGSFLVRYHEHVLPVSPRTLDTVLAAAAKRAGDAELDDIADRLARLPDAARRDPEGSARRHRDKEVLGRRLADLCARRPAVGAAIDAELAELNQDVDRLDGLLLRQNYRLAHWRTASDELDYRRFFNIVDLIGLRTEDPVVFTDTHELVLDLADRGIVDGFRVDHVDGLRDPAGYLNQLSERSSGRWVVVEKILELDEVLPPMWTVAGTSGYDFLNRVNGLFVDPAAEQSFTNVWQRFTGDIAAYPDIAHEAKQQIMQDELAVEVDRLVQLLHTVCDRHRRHRDHTRRDLVRACRELLASFPVYRTYAVPGQTVDATDEAVVAEAVRSAIERADLIDPELLSFVGELLRLEHDGEAEHEFALRFQQVSAPVMAKGVEDTAFYRYHRLISTNEVGGDPGRFGGQVESFHRWCEFIAEHWPHTMLTLSTHDTKRSADVRARLNVLSELPEAWAEATTRWRDLAHRHRRDGRPDRAVEYLMFQTLVGAWPIEPERLVAFLEKATKEAKLVTSWIAPDATYDEAVAAFARGVLGDHELVDEIERFLDEHRVVERGRTNALGQAALLLSCPGVPDIYQGSEVWDLSLVDPDNRRPVDYAWRRDLLKAVVDGGIEATSGRVDDGGPKLWLVHRLLVHRRRHPELYRSAGYNPVEVDGPQSEHLVAFTRDDELVTLVPRLVVGLDGGWDGTTVVLPPGRWTDLLSQVEVEGGLRPVADLLTRFPVSVLAREA